MIVNPKDKRGKAVTEMRKTWLAALAALLAVCLLPGMALALEAVEITSIQDHGDGTVTMTWDNPNHGPVTVGYLVVADEAAGNRIQVETDVYDDSYTFTTLAPGREYALLVMPEMETDYMDVGGVTVSVPPAFDDFRISVTDTNLTYFVMKGNDYSYNYAHDLSNRKILELLDEKDFWVRMNISLSARSQTITLPVLVVVTSPTDYVVAQYSEMELEKDWISFWRTMVYMNDAFADMAEQTGEIPAGKYTVEVYLDGRFLDRSSFTMTP